MVKGARSKAGGIRGKGQGGNTLAVVAKKLGRIGGRSGVVDADSVVGGGGGDNVGGVGSPNNGAQ